MTAVAEMSHTEASRNMELEGFKSVFAKSSDMLADSGKLKILYEQKKDQRTNGPVNAHLISWPSKAQNIRNLENIW